MTLHTASAAPASWRRTARALLGAAALATWAGVGASAAPVSAAPVSPVAVSTVAVATARISAVAVSAVGVSSAPAASAVRAQLGGVVHVAAGASGGDGSAGAPFGNLNDALAVAGPGATVLVGPGRYPGKVRTVRAGRADAPIRIVSNGAHLFNDGTSRLVEIDHDYVTLEGFELSHANILVVVIGAKGVRIEGNWFHGAASECLRLRYFAQSNQVYSNAFRDCGTARTNANGEAIYVGTAPERLDENPTRDADFSGGNDIRGNDIIVWGECVDIKEGADANLVTNNWCRGGEYVDGAALSTRARWTGFFNNWAEANLGSGMQLSGDRDGDGTHTWVVGNVLVNNGQYGLKVVGSAWPQHLMCGNVFAGNGRGATTPAGAGADRAC